MSDQANTAEAHADLYARHGELDPSSWEEAETVTDRANDTPLRGEDDYAVPNSTFGDRAKATKASAKAVDSADTENKAVTSASTKTTRRRRSAKSTAK